MPRAGPGRPLSKFGRGRPNLACGGRIWLRRKKNGQSLAAWPDLSAAKHGYSAVIFFKVINLTPSQIWSGEGHILWRPDLAKKEKKGQSLSEWPDLTVGEHNHSVVIFFKIINLSYSCNRMTKIKV